MSFLHRTFYEPSHGGRPSGTAWSFHGLAVIVILCIHTSLLAWQARQDSPTIDEVGHFASGIEHWKHGQFRMYYNNPPLVRLIALLPVTLTDPNIDPERYYTDPVLPGHRPEFQRGVLMVRDLGARYLTLLFLARLAVIPLSLVGAWTCYRWARELWGSSSGLVSLTLWAFSPTVLAYGHLITPDLGAAAIGVTACYSLRRWLVRPTAGRTVVTGILLGLCELTKSTWLILVVLWPALWVAYRLIHSDRMSRRAWTGQSLQLLGILAIALWILNLGYGFEGSLRRVDEYQFLSVALGGPMPSHDPESRLGNRFANSLVGAVRVPLPENYVMGLDFAKMEFEERRWSFLRGEWRLGGWWYYYVYAMLIKEPLGNLALLGLAIVLSVTRPRWYCAGLPDELLVLGLLLFVLSFVSSQTGFSHHIRYILPVFPFLCIWIGKVGRAFDRGQRGVVGIASALLGWSILSSLSVFPHSLSYFNEAVGGPKNGYRHLSDSNVDWGQDLLYLKKWYDAHPDARPLHLRYELAVIDPDMLGVRWTPIPVGPEAPEASGLASDRLGPRPGWYCLSVRQLHAAERRLTYFRDLTPVDWVGYTMPVYHVTLDEANVLRRRYGMKELSPKVATGPADSAP